MKNDRPESENARRMDPDGMSVHEKHRRIKREQERILRKQLCRLRAVRIDEIEAEAALPRRFKA